MCEYYCICTVSRLKLIKPLNYWNFGYFLTLYIHVCLFVNKVVSTVNPLRLLIAPESYRGFNSSIRGLKNYGQSYWVQMFPFSTNGHNIHFTVQSIFFSGNLSHYQNWEHSLHPSYKSHCVLQVHTSMFMYLLYLYLVVKVNTPRELK